MENKKEIKSIIICLLIICLLILYCCYLFNSVSMMESVEHSGTITMKWDSPKIVTTHYYFEIDNTTKLNIESYDYHKYNIGDIYTWETWE